jgi:glutathione peroxidase
MYKLLFSTLISLLSISVSAQTKNKSIYDFKVKSIDGSTFDFKSLKGKKIIIVNTASECGNTPQYSELEEIYKKYKSKNVVVIGFPANNFGGQEPGSEAEIKKFCTVNFNIDFPMTTKSVVRGPKAHPFYKWAKVKLGGQAEPKWNFHKILIGRDGQPIAGFASTVSPQDKTLKAAIEKAL